MTKTKVKAAYVHFDILFKKTSARAYSSSVTMDIYFTYSEKRGWVLNSTRMNNAILEFMNVTSETHFVIPNCITIFPDDLQPKE